MTGGRRHVTDYNASRTLLFNIHTLHWDDELLRVMGTSRCCRGLLIERIDRSDVGGMVWRADHHRRASPAINRRPHSARLASRPARQRIPTAQAVFCCGILAGARVASQRGLLTTVGWRIGDEVTYCLEGSVFVAGASCSAMAARSIGVDSQIGRHGSGWRPLFQTPAESCLFRR